MNLLHIDAGITGPASVSRQVSGAIVDAIARNDPTLTVIRRDLDAEPIAHLDSGNLAGLGQGEAGDVLQAFLDADLIVIGAPMYNLGVPSQLKAWIDRILVAGRTFRYTANGPEGLVPGKKVIIASARGGIYSIAPAVEIDFQERYLRAVFGLIGVTDVTFVRAEGVAVSPDHREAALNGALAAVDDLGRSLAPAIAA